uniref:Helicase-associated domain-containing protein n=1 Tax=Ditylum brightwellii TaxID=49249 RepID=A0A7S4RRI5_9STRA
MKKIDQLCAFNAQSGHCCVSQNDVQNTSLAAWIRQQRVSYKENTLISNHTQKLNSIGFIWDLCGHSWNEKFDQLCAFKAQSGHCCVSQNDVQNTSLAAWIKQQRVSYKENTLISKFHRLHMGST